MSLDLVTTITPSTLKTFLKNLGDEFNNLSGKYDELYDDIKNLKNKIQESIADGTKGQLNLSEIQAILNEIYNGMHYAKVAKDNLILDLNSLFFQYKEKFPQLSQKWTDRDMLSMETSMSDMQKKKLEHNDVLAIASAEIEKEIDHTKKIIEEEVKEVGKQEMTLNDNFKNELVGQVLKIGKELAEMASAYEAKFIDSESKILDTNKALVEKSGIIDSLTEKIKSLEEENSNLRSNDSFLMNELGRVKNYLENSLKNVWDDMGKSKFQTNNFPKIINADYSSEYA